MKTPIPSITKSAVLALLTFTTLGAASALADPQRATVRIENSTGRRIQYQFKWGADGPWKDFLLQAGENITHRKPYDPKGVPDPYINIATHGNIDGAVYKRRQLYMGFDDNPQRYYFVVKNNQVDLIRR